MKIAVSALAFAGFHIISPEFNFILFAAYFLFGLAKGYLFRLTGNLWPLFLFHMVWDLATAYTDFYKNPIIDLFCLAECILIVRLMAVFRCERGVEAF